MSLLALLCTAHTSTLRAEKIASRSSFDTQDGLYDLAWSEAHENQVVTASGDGSIKLWDISLAEPHPIRHWHEHAREVFCLDWNNVRKEVFASSSWDASVRVWHPERPSCMTAITTHTACVYGCAWSPHSADLLATACGDGHLRLFDLRSSSMTSAAPGVGASQAPVATVPVGGEVLSLDWNKYRPMTLATGSTDRAVKTWDLRQVVAASKPGMGPGAGPANTAIMMGHEYAVRKVAWSPHRANALASASYDMSARIWDVDAGERMAAGPLVGAGPRSQTAVHDAHTEFVVGLAWSLFQEGLVATCAWDNETHLWVAR